MLRKVYQKTQTILQNKNLSQRRIVFTGCEDPPFDSEDQGHKETNG